MTLQQLIVHFFAGELDDKMKWLKNFERLLEIQRNIVWPSVLDLEKQYVPDFLKTALSRQPCERLIVSPRRQILLEGPLMVRKSVQSTFQAMLISFPPLLTAPGLWEGAGDVSDPLRRPFHHHEKEESAFKKGAALIPSFRDGFL